MVNRYLLSDNVIERYMKVFWNKYIIGNIIISLAFLAFVLYSYITFRNPIFLLFVLVDICILSGKFANRNKSILSEIERIHIKYGDVAQYITTIFCGKIEITVNENSLNIPYDKIIKFSQTEEFIFIETKGNMRVVLKKDSFVEGSCEECLSFLKGLRK
ncbi:MAG: YcxB family protein [Lachnospiraceae bacterium]|nr:YcxB family protein [Lachnospiraceae bacterium]